MFASRTVFEHLARGVAAAFALVVAAMLPASATAWLAIPAAVLLIGAALVLLRGCPMCWTVGLFETIRMRKAPCAACDAVSSHPSTRVRPRA